MASLPQELYNNIFEHTASSDLSSCSLVCKAWLPSTRQSPLFQNTSITNHNADAFADLVINPYSSFPFCVQELTLDVNVTWLRRLLPFLQSSNAQSLRLSNIDWGRLDERAHSQFISCFSKTVRKLALGPAVAFENLVGATKLINQFSALKTLKMEDVHWSRVQTIIGSSSQQTSVRDEAAQTNSDYIIPPFYPLPADCRSFYFARCDLSNLSDWLHAHKPFPNIQTISIQDVDLSELIHLRAIYDSAGPTVKDLSLSFDVTAGEFEEHDCAVLAVYQKKGEKYSESKLRVPKDSLEFMQRVKGSRQSVTREGRIDCLLASLAKLRFNNFVYFSEKDRSCGVFYAVHALAFLACRDSCELKEVVCGIMLHRAGDLDRHQVDWVLLDAVLLQLADFARAGQEVNGDDGSSFGTGFRVIFEIGGGANVEATTALIQAKLHRSHEENIVKFREVV